MHRLKDFDGHRPPLQKLRLTQPPLQQWMTPRSALSLHSVEGFLEKFQIARVTGFLATALNPFFLESIFCRPVVLVKDAEDAGERQLRQFVGGELVGNVVTQLVLRGVVPFLFLDHFEATAFFRIGRIEYVRKKFDALGQTFDDGEALVIKSALDHVHHVFDLGGVGTRDEGGPAGDEFFHRIDRLIDRAGRIGLALETDGRRRRGLLFGQAIDEVVHDEIGHVDVLARTVIDMVAANREAVAVAAEEEDLEVGPGEADAGGERDAAAMDEVGAVAVDEIREARGAADAGEGDDFLVIDLAFLQDLVIAGENGEVAAAGTPRRVIGGNGFFGEFLALRSSGFGG
jgi:hypothetical protein